MTHEQSSLQWNLREVDHQTLAYVTQMMFGELLIYVPIDGVLNMEVRSERNGQPTYNSRYLVPLEENNGHAKIESKVIDARHDSIVPIAQLDYWLTQLLGVFEERKVVSA